MIQCFYDVATVSGEPVRNRALKYVEQLAHRWKHSVMVVRGWKVGAVPTPDEVIQALIGMYCMERVGIHHDLKHEVRSFMCQDPPVHSVKDYLGWDPLAGPPPTTGHRGQIGDRPTGCCPPAASRRPPVTNFLHVFQVQRP